MFLLKHWSLKVISTNLRCSSQQVVQTSCRPPLLQNFQVNIFYDTKGNDASWNLSFQCLKANQSDLEFLNKKQVGFK